MSSRTESPRVSIQRLTDAVRRLTGTGSGTRPSPGELPPLVAWSRAPDGPTSSAPVVAVLVYRGVSSTEAELVADALARPLGAHVRLVSADGGPVVAVEPARRVITEPLDAVPEPYGVVIPGGLGWKLEAGRPEIAQWLPTALASARGVLAVSTGSLLLASVGHLAGREATGHWLGADLLEGMGARARSSRIVRERRLVTATGARAGVEAAADLAREMRFGPR